MKNGFNMSDADLLTLVGQVQAELAAIAKSDADKATRLAKSDSPSAEESTSASESPSASASASPSASSSPSASPEASASAAPEGSAPVGVPAEGPAPEQTSVAPPMDAPAAPEHNPEAAQGPSFEELVSLYSSLPPEDFEAHASAIQQAAQMKSKTPAGPDAASAGAPPMAPPPPAMKSEDPKVKEMEGKMAEMSKSMTEMTKVIEGLGKVITAPQRKAMTGFSFIPMQKSEEVKPEQKKFQDMSKGELFSALKEKSASPSLKKSERELINSYVLGNAKREELASLFSEKK